MPKGMRLAVALLLAGAIAQGVLSQELPAPPKPGTDATTFQPQKPEVEPKAEVSVQETTSTFKLRVNLVQVHVVVRGEKDKIVDGLRKEDFQLYDNGKLQTISTFALENDQSRKERTEAAGKTQVDGEENAVRLSGTMPERFVAVVFDDIHLLTSDVDPMRIAANGFIDSMALADRVGLFTTSGLLTQDFTSDKELLKKELLKVMSRGHVLGNPGNCPNVSYEMAVQVAKEGGPPVSLRPGEAPDSSTAYAILYEETLRCSPGLSGTAVAAILEAEIRRVTEEGDAENRNVYKELQNVLRLLASKPGERILLLASPGFPISDLTTQMSGVVDGANRSNIVINAIVARGLYTTDLLGDISVPGSDPPELVGQAANYRTLIQTEQQFVLMDFAYGTSGRFFHNSNNLEGGLKQLGSVPEVSYVLGFSPANQKMDGHFHTIKVTVTGKQKYSIQARRGYFAPKRLEDPAEIAKQEIQDAVLSRDEIFDLPLSLQTQYFKTANAEVRLSVVSHLDVQNMKFRKSEGRNYNQLTVATVIFDENGKFVMGNEKLVKIRLLDASIERLGHSGFVVKSTFDLKPGRYLVRQVVRDSEGPQMAARSGIVDIPD